MVQCIRGEPSIQTSGRLWCCWLLLISCCGLRVVTLRFLLLFFISSVWMLENDGKFWVHILKRLLQSIKKFMWLSEQKLKLITLKMSCRSHLTDSIKSWLVSVYDFIWKCLHCGLKTLFKVLRYHFYFNLKYLKMIGKNIAPVNVVMTVNTQQQSLPRELHLWI